MQMATPSKKSYKVLFVGQIYDHHLRRVISRLKEENPNAIIDVFTLNGTRPLTDDIKDVVRNWYFPYKQDHVTKYMHQKVALAYLLSSRRLLRQIAKQEHYNCVNIHFPLFFHAYIIKELKALSNTFLVTPWGSEVYGFHGWKLKQTKRIFDAADKVCGIGNRFNRDVQRIFNVPSEKFVYLDIMSDSIDAMADYSGTVEEAKKYFNVEDKYVITCGYNATSAQQHEQIIDAINSVKDKLPKNLVLFFPMTYSKVESYMQHIRNLLEQTGIPYRIFDSFLTQEELVYLRYATDLFVHMQKTDANSSSIREFIICKKKIVNCSWLRYGEFEQFGCVPYFIAENFDTLGQTILDVIEAPAKEMPQALLDMLAGGGTKKMIKRWDAFFSSCQL